MGRSGKACLLYTSELQQDVQADRNEILSKSSQKMSDVIKKLAEEKGVDLIVDSATTLYLSLIHIWWDTGSTISPENSCASWARR